MSLVMRFGDGVSAEQPFTKAGDYEQEDERST